MRRLARAVLVAMLVLLVAVTPLSAIFRPGYFDLVFPLDPFSSGWERTHFILEDQTGLVEAMTFAHQDAQPTTSSAPTRLLHVTWAGGCDEQLVYLVFYARGDGYVVDKWTTSNGCPFMIGIQRELIFVLRAPIDPSSVQLIDRSKVS